MNIESAYISKKASYQILIGTVHHIDRDCCNRKLRIPKRVERQILVAASAFKV